MHSLIYLLWYAVGILPADERYTRILLSGSLSCTDQTQKNWTGKGVYCGFIPQALSEKDTPLDSL